jgi:xylulokinase
MNTAVLMGVDVGSSGAKAIAIDPDGRTLSRGRSDYETRYPRNGWAEQDPEDWFAGTCNAIRSCLEAGAFSPGQIQGISFDGPAHNVALLGKDDRLLRSCIHWSDLRSVPQSSRLLETAGERIFRISGQPVNPSWTLSQLAWVRANEPETWARLDKILVTKDYVRYRFTGEYVTDPYDAVGTQLFDLSAGAWSDALCCLIDLDRGLLPRVLPSHALAGRLRADVATRLGLPIGLSVAVGGGDSAVEAFGVGAACPGDCVVKIGTSGCVNVVTRHATPSPRTLTYPYLLGDLGFTIAVTSNGTAALRWFRSGLLAPAEMSFEQVVRLAASAPAGSNGLIFHPYLMGERTPYWDPRLRGGFIGLSPRHGVADLARAVLEGVAYSLRDCLETVRAMGLETRSMSLLGGGSRSALWASIAASVLNCELRKPGTDDAAVGAAMLAGVGSGVFPDWSAAARSAARDARVIAPEPGDAATYDRYFAVFKGCARDIAPHYHALYELSRDGEPTTPGGHLQ